MYQPRYLAYCAVQGRAPEAQLAHDKDAWPGGSMAGFILWINARWTEWNALTGWPSGETHGKTQHEEFDLWLRPEG